MSTPSTTDKPTPPSALGGTPLDGVLHGINACVHCGFCLQACPTYLTLEDENDSPRGRIFLMRSLLEGTAALQDEAVHKHIAQCLGCRACETACPSGVPYGSLLEATRATLAQVKPISRIARLILFVFERPILLRMMMAGARLLAATPIPTLLSNAGGRLGFAMAMLASTESRLERSKYEPKSSGTGATVSLLRGCVMDGLFTETNRATVRTLQVNGYQCASPDGQGCCGALHAHAGDLEGARQLARRNIAAFEQVDADFIAVNSAGCGSLMKEYGDLLRDDPAWHERAERVAKKVRDISELLAEAGPVAGAPLPARVAYDPPCHLLHAQRIVDPPLTVLRAIPGLELIPLAEADLCCGSAGIYNLIEPYVSDLVLDRKLDHIEESGAAYVATGNPGCLMQIGAGLLRSGLRTRAIHPVDLLDASYAARG
jgi:glycolate oxidase iron-sulfur subunit